jgi:hypothetical protein
MPLLRNDGFSPMITSSGWLFDLRQNVERGMDTRLGAARLRQPKGVAQKLNRPLPRAQEHEH